VPLLRPERPPPAPARGESSAAIAGGGVIVLAAALLAWVYTVGSRDAQTEPLAMPPEPAASSGSTDTQPIPAREVAPSMDTSPTAVARESAGRTETPRSSNGPSVSVPQITRYDGSQVARRPGESADAWRARTAAFQTRYAYSRAALERGDFAAAAGGFEAILQEEPGYLDVPQLLVKARAGLRDVARAVYEAGDRLDKAGDWLGALQKYEQALQIHPDVRGLPEAIRRVREKLRTEGEGAFTRARRFDEGARWADALKEYEKAVQWLPNDDPRWEMAQSRVEQLKRQLR
jgi:tetratricopeptide (TPR) repeat protein